jgi:hypothetical protein
MSVFRLLRSGLIVVLLMTSVSAAHAADFTEFLLRPERMKTGESPLPILVQFTPSSVATEAKLVLQLDSRLTSGIHFSTNPGSYTTSTAGIPAGTTALTPTGGIAASVSGHTITFDISDLSSGTTYAFFITGGFSANSSPRTYMTVASTKTAGDVTIDTANVWTEVITDDQITVTGTVPPLASSMQLNFDTSAPLTVNQGDVLTYTIRYQSNETTTTPMTLQAEWYEGTIDGAASPSVDVVSYQPGSSTRAYGNTEPVIDLSNNTITWTIPAIPANAGEQSVSFELKASDSYTGNKKVRFPVAARITHPSSVGDVVVYRDYLYDQNQSSPAAPTETIAPSVTQSPMVPPTSTTTNTGTRITSVLITAISATSVTIDVETNINALLSLSYGTSKTLLGNSVFDARSSRFHSFTLANLSPDSTYYFRLFESSGGRAFPLSELYSFQTAQQSLAANTSAPRLLNAAQSWGFLYSLILTNGGEAIPLLIAPKETVMDLQFSIPNSSAITSATLTLRPTRVLGIDSENNSSYQSQSATATHISNGIHVVKLMLPNTSGTNHIVLQYEDVYGNKTEHILAQMTTVEPLRIQNQQGNALVGSSALISRYNEKTKLFEVLPDSASSIHNPSVANDDGIVPIPFYPGKYSVVVSFDGYESKTMVYTINPKQQEDLPLVTLERLLVTPSTTLQAISSSVSSLPQKLVTTSVPIWMLLVSIMVHVIGALMWLKRIRSRS